MRTTLLLLLIVVFGCGSNETSGVDFCPTAETVENFPWVMELVDNLGTCSPCATSVVRGTYSGKTVIFTVMNAPNCDGLFTGPLYDCRGRLVEYISLSERDQRLFQRYGSINMILGQCEDVSNAPFDLGG
jgi:hypothetical protein